MTITRGTKSTGWLEFTFPPTGEPIRFPMGMIHGAHDGPRLVVLGGMHGSEYAGIEAAIRLYHEVDPAALHGALQIGMIYNLPAFQKNMGFVVPQDGRNPSGAFPGALTGTYSEAMAYYFTEEVLKKADYTIELHGGDIPEALIPFAMVPITGNPDVDARSRAMAVAYNLPVVASRNVADPANPARSGFSTSALRGTPAILTESGQQGILDLREVETHLIGLRNVLAHLGMMPGPIVNTVKRMFSEQHQAIRSELEGMWYPAVKLGDWVTEGQVVGTLRDYFGEELGQVKAVFSGLVTVLRTSPATSVNTVLLEEDRITSREE